jgi:hypothetical protein
VVVDPSVAEQDELSGSGVRGRTIVAIILFVCAIPLFVWDWKSDSSLNLPTVVAINMMAAGLRLLYWNTARSERAREQARRFEGHLKCERSSQKTENI